MSRSDFDALWVQPNLKRMSRSEAEQVVAAVGRALPCKVQAVNGPLVTVSLEVTSHYTLPQLTMPVAMSQWLRVPVQVGDLGMTQAADTFLGGITGQGSERADLAVSYGNLSSLVFVPIACTNFPDPPDANKAWVNGPNGAVLSDADQTVTVTADKAKGQVIVQAGSLTLIVDKSGTVQLGGSGTSSGNGIVRESDLQAAINAAITAIVNWAHLNLQSGTSAAPGPTNPTVTASSVSFTA